MGASGKYQQLIRSDLLREEKVIIARTKAELRTKVDQQLRTWKQQETQLVDAQAAEIRTQEAKALLLTLDTLLQQEVRKGIKPGWNGQGSASFPYPPFLFEPAPTYEESEQLFPPPQGLFFFAPFQPGLRKQREEMIAHAQHHYQQKVAEYKELRAKALNEYKAQRRAYEQGDAGAIRWVLEQVLAHLNFPCGYGTLCKVDFDEESEEAVVKMFFPHVDEMPTVTAHRYIRSRKVIEEMRLKARDIQDRYENLLAQITLATMFRVFHDATTQRLQSVVFNGYVQGIHPATGRLFKSCILTVRAKRTEFEALNLERVTPTKCLRNLRGLTAGPLIDLTPVQPIRVLQTQDDRFVETEDVLTNYPSTVNIATMHWRDFEHLIATLFNKIFESFGGEVHLTRPSSDAGVDAVAFDPDPIRGGKIIIQAKRYQDLVPKSAVRELIGAMGIERATRGYLVTTGRFSRDARELASEHNVTLFDGRELLHQLHTYGFLDATFQQ